MSALAPTLQAFFTDRLIRQRHASSHTIAAYRDTLRLLIGYATQRTGIAPSQLDLADLDAPLITAFLDHLEHERGNSVRTRNARLAAIHSLFRYAALTHPEHADSIARVLAIPPKRFDRALITYLKGYGSPNSPRSPAPTSTSAPARTSPATAKDAKTGSPRSPAAPSPRYTAGSTSSAAITTIRCSRLAAASRSAATRSSTASRTTPIKPQRPAHPCGARRSPRTCCGTPPRCGYCTPPSTPASSRSGSATSASTSPRSTCTPTSS